MDVRLCLHLCVWMCVFVCVIRCTCARVFVWMWMCLRVYGCAFAFSLRVFGCVTVYV